MEIKKNDLLGPLTDSLIKRSSENKETSKTKSSDSSRNLGLKEASFDVRVSPEAAIRKQLFEQAFKIAQETNPIREDRVKELKEKIANGSYQVDSGKIADGMLKEAVLDELAKNPDVGL